MARTRPNPADSLRSRLAEASSRLTEGGAPELAGAVDRILAPGGWELLRHTDPAKAEGSSPLAIPVLKVIHDQITAAVKADPEAPSVTAKVNEGLQKFLDGEFVLPKRVGTKATEGQTRSMLNVRALTLLSHQVSKLGHSPARVAAEYLMSCYQLGPYAPDALTVLSRGAERLPNIPRVVRDEIRAKADASGWRADDVINEGLQKFLDGEFDPIPPAWTDEARSDMAFLKVRPNDDLFQKVAEAAKGRGLRPLQVAIAYLLDEYGITVGVASPVE